MALSLPSTSKPFTLPLLCYIASIPSLCLISAVLSHAAVSIAVLSPDLPQALRQAISQKLHSHWAEHSKQKGTVAALCLYTLHNHLALLDHSAVQKPPSSSYCSYLMQLLNFQSEAKLTLPLILQCRQVWPASGDHLHTCTAELCQLDHAVACNHRAIPEREHRWRYCQAVHHHQ